MITVKEISDKHGISNQLLYQRLKQFGINPKEKISRTNYYNKGTELIITSKRPQIVRPAIFKLKVIEYYLMFERQPLKNTADELGITHGNLIKIVAEWRRNDKCIIMRSKI